MSSIQTTYDQFTIFISTGDSIIPLFELLLPANSRANRCDAVMRILQWIKELRRWFSGPGLVNVKLSEFLDRVSLHSLIDVRLSCFDKLTNAVMNEQQCSTYSLAIGTESELEELNRDLTGEEFTARLVLILMA